MRAVKVGLAAALLLCSVNGAARAQPEPSEAPSTFAETIDVRVVNAPPAAAEAPTLPNTPERWLAEAAAHYQRSDLEQMASAARRALELTNRGPGARVEEDPGLS